MTSARVTRRANPCHLPIAYAELRIAFAIRSASADERIADANSSTRNCQSRSARICCGAWPSARSDSSRRRAVPESRHHRLGELEDVRLDRAAHERAGGERPELGELLVHPLAVRADRAAELVDRLGGQLDPQQGGPGRDPATELLRLQAPDVLDRPARRLDRRG